MKETLLNSEHTYTLSVSVSNKPGVLARIAQVFARRAYNIDSLVVSSSVDGQFSRMTITAKGDPKGLDQIHLISVWQPAKCGRRHWNLNLLRHHLEPGPIHHNPLTAAS